MSIAAKILPPGVSSEGRGPVGEAPGVMPDLWRTVWRGDQIGLAGLVGAAVEFCRFRLSPAGSTVEGDARGLGGAVSDVARLQQAIAAFVEAREWKQFHTPRNLILALVREVGELAAEVQGVSESDVASSDALEMGLADVAIYLLPLADVLDVDIVAAVEAKLQVTEGRYPVAQSRGNAMKYMDLA